MGAQKGSGALGVVVFQLGGPDSLAAVEPFLYKLFSDPDIIDFPFARLARPTLARLISSRRARHVAQHYAEIGGKSPIRELTERQAAALERELRESRGLDARVVVAMRYWHPLTEAAVEQVARGNFRELVLLPLYPQYSKTTTGSSLNEWHRQHATNGHRPVPIKTIHHFFDHPAYLDTLVEKINEGLGRFRPTPSPAVAPGARHAPIGDQRPASVILSPDGVHRDEESQQFEMKKSLRGGYPEANAGILRRVYPERQLTKTLRVAQGDSEWAQDDRQMAQDETRGVSGDKSPRPLPASAADSPQSASSADDVWLVFSAHGVPMRVIESGDPYQKHVEETVRLVMERGGWPNPHVLCYQSRVSPGKWLEPSLGDTLRSLAAPDPAAPDGAGRDRTAASAGDAISPDGAGRSSVPDGTSCGARRVLVIPISFVTDHVETLAEINIEARHLAQQLGIAQFELMPALNDSPAFIRALADLVLAQMDAPPRAT